MSTTTKRTLDVERYVEAVRAHLRDLPAADVAELLEDLQQHLAEVASEDDTPLAERLGPPERYAEELRVSAGLPASADEATSRLATTTARLAEAAERWAAHPWLKALRAPGVAWWIARGYAVALAIGLGTSWTSALEMLPFVLVGRDPLAGMVVTLLAVAVSVAAGRRARVYGRPALDRLCTVFLLLLVFPAVGTLRAMTEQVHYEDLGPGVPEGALARPDGSVVTNVYPYGPDGRPLERVLLYDQDGRPIELTPPYSAEGVPMVTSYPLDDDGRPVTNAYPQHQAFRDPSGDPAYRDGPRRPSPDVPALAEESPSASPSPAPSAAPSEAPTDAPSDAPPPSPEVSPGP